MPTSFVDSVKIPVSAPQRRSLLEQDPKGCHIPLLCRTATVFGGLVSHRFANLLVKQTLGQIVGMDGAHPSRIWNLVSKECWSC